MTERRPIRQMRCRLWRHLQRSQRGRSAAVLAALSVERFRGRRLTDNHSVHRHNLGASGKYCRPAWRAA